MSTTTWYLQMTDRSQFQPKFQDIPHLRIEEMLVKDFRINRFLYSLVGGDWWWTDKLPWSDEQWKTYAEDPTLKTYIVYISGTPAGYFEIQLQPNRNVELVYFGLSSLFIGKGIGGHLLSKAVETMWSFDSQRVWVHTCNKDHPGALQNYLSRGFELYDTVVEE